MELNNPPDLSTPIIFLPRTGWTPHIEMDKPLAWGHRFDPGIGYRVFLKYADSENINAFPPLVMHGIIQKIKQMAHPQLKILAKNLNEVNESCEKMNKIWADAGCPDAPIDQLKDAGNA